MITEKLLGLLATRVVLPYRICRGGEDAQDKSMITGDVVSANVETVGSMSLRPLSCYDRLLSIVGGMKHYL